jgi:vancomycin resistance protein YoaR
MSADFSACKRRRMLMVFVLFLLTAFMGDYFYYRQRIFAGVFLGGTAIGGLKPALAEEMIHLATDAFTEEVLLFEHAQESWPLSTEELGVAPDVVKSVQNAYAVGRRRFFPLSYPARLRLLFQPQNLSLTFDIAIDSFYRALSPAAEYLYRAPREAEFRLAEDNKQVDIVPEAPGQELDLELTALRLKEALGTYPVIETVELAVRESPPTRVASQLEKLKVREEMVSFSTAFSTANLNRVHNIRLAAQVLDGVLVEPGEVFSFNETVGDTTKDLGYRPAPIIVNRRLVEGIGGGVCQVSTTLYNAVLLAGLSVTERTNHSLQVGYVPPGLDATVAFGWLDFKFLNQREHAVWIRTALEGNNLFVRIYGDPIAGDVYKLTTTDLEVVPPPVQETKNPELPVGERVKIKDGQPGYRVTVWRVLYREGEEVHREKLSRDEYHALPEEYQVGTGDLPVGTVEEREETEAATSDSPQ